MCGFSWLRHFRGCQTFFTMPDPRAVMALLMVKWTFSDSVFIDFFPFFFPCIWLEAQQNHILSSIAEAVFDNFRIFQYQMCVVVFCHLVLQNMYFSFQIEKTLTVFDSLVKMVGWPFQTENTLSVFDWLVRAVGWPFQIEDTLSVFDSLVKMVGWPFQIENTLFVFDWLVRVVGWPFQIEITLFVFDWLVRAVGWPF